MRYVAIAPRRVSKYRRCCCAGLLCSTWAPASQRCGVGSGVCPGRQPAWGSFVCSVPRCARGRRCSIVCAAQTMLQPGRGWAWYPFERRQAMVLRLLIARLLIAMPDPSSGWAWHRRPTRQVIRSGATSRPMAGSSSAGTLPVSAPSVRPAYGRDDRICRRRPGLFAQLGWWRRAASGWQRFRCS